MIVTNKIIRKDLDSFLEYLEQKGKGGEWADLARDFLPDYLLQLGSVDDPTGFTRSWAAKHIAGGSDPVRKILLMIWYHGFCGDMDSSTYLITLLGTCDVLESQRERLDKLFGEAAAESVWNGIVIPPLGSDILAYPPMINRYLERLRSYLPEMDCQKVLAGNHHLIDPNQFAEEKELFSQSPSLEEYLKGHHARLVAKLQEHADSGKMWFEQVITQEVVDYVSQHQEIQTGVMEGERLLIHKIPYAPDAWLKEDDPDRKRHLACHCPFVRETIAAGIEVPNLWCHCSAGFTKVMWEYLFDRELKVELLSSVLSGDQHCGFAIELPTN
jgi:hypothetical protein